MHYTLILYHNEKEHLSLVRWLIDSLREKTQLSQNQEEGVIEGADRVLVRFCPVNENFEVVDGGIGKQWTTLNSLKIENVSRSLDAWSTENEPDSSENVPILPDQNAAFLPNHLHDIADSLPLTGFSLDVYVISLDMKIESCMLTVGALLRLREWHKAQVHLVGEAEKRDDKVTLTLCKVLNATFLCADQLACVPWPAWRGDLVWPGEKGFVQQGIRLECADRERWQDKLLELEYWNCRSCEEDCEMEDIRADAMLGHHLEVLTHVRLNSVPLYLIDDFSLQLTQASPFGQLVGTLNHKDALLLRIPLFRKGPIPLASAHGLTTAAWKEGIAASAQTASDPGKGPLSCRQYLFLMISGDQDISCPLTVNVLCSPSEVDPELLEEVHEACFYGCAPLAQTQTVSDNKICDLVDNLQLLTAADFRSTDDACSQSLVQCIKEKKSKAKGEGPVEVTEGELLACVREGQELFLQQGQKQSLSCFGERKPAIDFGFVPFQDLERLCSEWPERRALLENESKAKVLRRYQSNESCSLMLSSPLGPEDSSMDAKDMVKWFRPDGNAVHEDLSPVKPAVHPLQLSNYEEVNLEWPACKDLQYHDVYYEHTKKSEKQEKFFQKFRDNILLEESLHVCSDKPGVPALRYRNHSRRSQMDISCGGSKLTPITRQTLSPNSMLQATPSAKRRVSRESEGQKSPRSRSSTRSDGHFSVPKARKGKDRSRSSEGHRSGRQKSSETLSSFEETSKENSSESSSSVFYPKGSDPTLPPFRRLSQPDVSIFTPVSSQKPSGHAPSGSDSSLGGGALSRKQSFASSSSGKVGERQQSSESMDSTTPRKSNRDRKARSQKHKRRLEKVVTKVLGEAGVSTNDTLYTACFSKLYQVSYFYAKQLPDSHNLKGELKSIAEKQVEQVVDLERRRQDLAVKKKLRKSSLVGQKPSE